MGLFNIDNKLIVQVKHLFKIDVWDEVCESKGWNPWIINEGLIDKEDYIEVNIDLFDLETLEELSKMY